eukprot:gene7277-9919_t
MKKKSRRSSKEAVSNVGNSNVRKYFINNREDNMNLNKDAKNNIHILGTSYDSEKHLKMIRNHTESFFRFTYRRDFPALIPYNITSDAGWGCMLRSAQMMMGYTLLRHYMGKDWRKPSSIDKLRENKQYCEIMKWFLDYPGYPHVYALHHLVQCGMKYDKLPGEWYAPSTAALVLRDLTKLHRVKYKGPLEIMVTSGDTIYISEAEKLCCNSSLDETPWSHSLMIMIPLRLGINSVNETYYQELKELLQNKYCVGILGGRVGHAIYFVGIQDNTLL